MTPPNYRLFCEEIDNIQWTRETDYQQLTVAIRIANDHKLFISTVYCPHGNPSMELIDGMCDNREQIILTADLKSKHPELGNDHPNSSEHLLINSIQKDNLTLVNDGTPT